MTTFWGIAASDLYYNGYGCHCVDLLNRGLIGDSKDSREGPMILFPLLWGELIFPAYIEKWEGNEKENLTCV